MITITIYGLDQFVVGRLSREMTPNLAKLYELSEDEILFVAPENMVFHKGVEQTSWNIIIHVHAPYLSSFASSGRDLMAPIMAENVFYFGGIPLADYALPSSMELVENTVKYFDKYDAVLMANHGFVIGSKTIEDAYMKLELAESYAQVVLNTEILGGAKLLTDEQAGEILKLRQ